MIEDSKTQGDKIVKQRQEALTDFQKTIPPANGKMYTAAEIESKRKCVEKINEANDEMREWLSSVCKQK